MTELIRVDGLTKSFQTPAGELHVLNGIDMVLNNGEMVGVTGISGAGKSTFLHILGALDRPTSGKITYRIRSRNGERNIDPFSLGDGELAAFRNHVVGFVFQFHYLLPEFTSVENVMMPAMITRGSRVRGVKGSSGTDNSEIEDRAKELLSELGLHARKDHRPGELSGGEQQRVAVARALLLEPDVVLADEPTGNLDSATGEDLFRLLLDINSKQGTAFVIVTHNESLSGRCGRIMKMVDGRLFNAKID